MRYTINQTTAIRQQKVYEKYQRSLRDMRKLSVDETMFDVTKPFGENVRIALQERGWSNAELGRRSGYSTTFIGNVIRAIAPGTKSGKLRLTEEAVDRLAKVLDFPLEAARISAGLSPVKMDSTDLEVALFFSKHSRLTPQRKRDFRRVLEIFNRELDRELTEQEREDK